MDHELFFAFVTFCFVSSFTPGPNNLMLMASGANFGPRRTIRHVLGVSGGFAFMIVLVGLGLAEIFEIWPVAHRALKVVSVCYLLWLAWKIATAAAPGGGSTGAQPLTFWQAAAFQWVNPKAWTMALTAVSVYSPAQTPAAILVTAAIFGAINLPSCSVWIFLGQQAARFLSGPTRLRIFNGCMAALLVGSLYPVLA